MREIIYEGIKFKEPDFVGDNNSCHGKVRIAIKNKILKRGVCEICGKTQVFAHHEVYSDYLNVRWLCRSHHLRLHAIFRRLNPRILIEIK